VSKLYPADGLRPKIDRRETQPRVSGVPASAIYSPRRFAFRGADRRASHPLWERVLFSPSIRRAGIALRARVPYLLDLQDGHPACWVNLIRLILPSG